MKKPLFFIILFLLIVVAIVALVSRQRPLQKPIAPNKSFLVAPAPPIIFVPNAPINVVFVLSQNVTGSIPTSLPLYVVSPFLSERIVTSFATLLKAGDPKTVITKEINKNFFWTTPDLSLSYTQKPTISTMSFQHSSGGLPSPQTNNEDASRSFLEQMLGKERAASFDLQSQSNQTSEGGNSANASEATVFIYEFRINNFPVLLSGFESASASITISKNNAIVSASLVFPPQIVSQQAPQTIASIESVLSSLNNNRGLLISSLNSQGDKYGALPEFSSVEVKKITPVYYYDTDRLLLEPSYLIDGIGTTQNKTQVVQYFLRATE